MKLHRFFIGDEIELKHNFWVHNKETINQWFRVLRFRPGQEIVLFDGQTHDRMYRITDITEREAHVEHVTDLKRQVPEKELFLFWSLLKKDKNDWVLQKATEIGISHFIPLLADRSEKTGFNIDRAKKIIIEAAEQCGRSDIPSLREPMRVDTALRDYKSKLQLYVAEEGSTELSTEMFAAGVFIGPEGGWSEQEKQMFTDEALLHIGLGSFTLRAETAAVTAAYKLLQ